MNAKTEFTGRWWGAESGEILHNLLPQHWASLTREAVEEAGKLGEVIYWMRAGGTESKYHQVTVVQNPDFPLILSQWGELDKIPKSGTF